MSEIIILLLSVIIGILIYQIIKSAKKIEKLAKEMMEINKKLKE